MRDDERELLLELGIGQRDVLDRGRFVLVLAL